MKKKYEIAKFENQKSVDIKKAAWMALSEESQNAYQSDYDIFFKFIKKNIKEVNASDIMKFIEHMQDKNFKNSTINRKIASLSKMFGIMKIAGEIKDNPVEILKQFKKINLKTSKEVKISLTIEDIRKVTKTTKLSSDLEKKLSLIIRMLAQTGLRISEMTHVKNSDITVFDDKNMLVKILGKGKKERSIFINNAFLNEKRRTWPEISAVLWLFYNRQKRYYDRKQLYQQVKTIFQRKIGKKTSPHQMRHFFITRKISFEGQDIKAVSKYAGHQSIGVTLDMYVDTSLSVNNAKLKI